MASDGPLAAASLDEAERRTIDRFVEQIRERLGDQLVSVWLYGSRARGEKPHPESDIDLMVVGVVDADDRWLANDLIFDVALQEGAEPFAFSVHMVDPGWIQQRREIRSFFIQEVDRDKLVLAGQS